MADFPPDRYVRSDDDGAVVAHEIVGDADRRRHVEEVWRVQPWYAQQPYSLDDWVASAPIVVLTRSGGEPEG